MASNKFRDLLRQAHSSRIKHTYNALVEIRKKFIKTPKDVAAVVSSGLVKRLLDLIRSRSSLEEQYSSKVIDISLSILSNMCMESVTRKKVLKDKGTGVTIIVDLFEEVETECLQNRACRCLSNLLLDPGSWKLVCTSSVIEKIVKLLNDTDKEEYKQTCIRALRLLGQTGSHVQKLVEKNAVYVVLKLIDSDTDSLKQSSLRCVHSLVSHGRTLQLASQVIAAGKLPYLLTLVKDSNIEALQVVIHLCEFHNFRAEFGNVGGIAMFQDMFLSSEPFCEKSKEDLLSVLCLCCKEAVNRVKLRDKNILILFTQALSDDKLTNLHARVISALVCFLYDEASFDVLLENGLVPLLVKKLSNCLMREIDRSSVEDGDELKETNEEKIKQDILDRSGLISAKSVAAQQNISDEGNERKIEAKQNIATHSCRVKRMNASERTREEGKAKKNIPEKSDTENIDVKDDTENKVKDETENNDVKDRKNEENETGSEIDKCKEEQEKGPSGEILQHAGSIKDVSDDEFEGQKNYQCEKKANSRPVYSIDSPTYQPNFEWEQEDYEGAKCIERFTPPHNEEYSYKKTYSPMSNSSYYSPVESSPEYSPPSSPDNFIVSEGTSRNIFPHTILPDCHVYSPLTGSQSPENFHPKYPKYTGVGFTLYTTSLSPDREKSKTMSPCSSNYSSPERPVGHENKFNVSSGTVSQSPVEEVSEDPLANERSGENSVNNPKEKGENSHSAPVFLSNSNSNDKDNSDKVNQSLFDSVPHEHISENLSKLKEVLILEEECSTKRKKVSNRSNVTEYNILILLSRVSQMTNPTMHLVTKEVLNCLLDYISIMEGPLARCPRLLSRVFRNPICFDKIFTHCVPTLIFDKLLRFEDLQTFIKDFKIHRKMIKKKSSYGKAEIHHEVETDSDRFSLSDDLLLVEERAIKRRRTYEDSPALSHSFKGQYHRQEEDVCDMGKSAIAFLEDLSGVVDSNFGRGVVDRLLLTVSRDQMTDLCINVLHITWMQASRQRFFSHREILDEVMSVFQPLDRLDDQQFVHAVNGLRLLVHIIDTKSKYQTLKTKRLYSKYPDLSPMGNTFKDKSPSKNISVTFETALGEDERVRNKKPKKNDKLCGENIAQGRVGSHVAITTNCCLTDGTVAMDTVFIVTKSKVFANRAILVEKSEIFAAMLEGHYSEAKMSEISIPESSKFAFEFLIHYFHGCLIGGCAFIDQLYKQSVNKHTAEQCINLLEEANKYMVSELYDMANECLFCRYIIPDSAFSVLKYALLHRDDSLLKAAVSCIFYDCKRTEQVVGLLSDIMSSCYAEIFLSTVRKLFVHGDGKIADEMTTQSFDYTQ